MAPGAPDGREGALRLFRRSPGRTSTTRLFFAADLHGATPTFRKFAAAARFYGADVVAFGGDLMGKALVPIVAGPRGTYRAELHGVVEELDGRDAVRAFVRRAEATGFYWAVVDREAYAALLADPAAVEAAFVRLARERLASWMALAEERLAGTGVRLYLTGGNDDVPEVLDLLEEAAGEHVRPCEHRVVELDHEHTMVTVGYSTPTPWQTPRERSEEEIAAAIDASMAAVPDPARCVFNLHCPPLASGLDSVLQVRPTPEGLPRPVLAAGRPALARAGSRAVRDAVVTYQPVVGLHGHVHESPGRRRYGRTQCFNPGSEYSQGVLRGVLVSLRGGRLVGYQVTAG